MRLCSTLTKAHGESFAKSLEAHVKTACPEHFEKLKKFVEVSLLMIDRDRFSLCAQGSAKGRLFRNCNIEMFGLGGRANFLILEASNSP